MPDRPRVTSCPSSTRRTTSVRRRTIEAPKETPRAPQCDLGGGHVPIPALGFHPERSVPGEVRSDGRRAVDHGLDGSTVNRHVVEEGCQLDNRIDRSTRLLCRRGSACRFGFSPESRGVRPAAIDWTPSCAR